MEKKKKNIIKEADSWMDIEGVTSIAESKRDGKPCILVTVSGNLEEVKKKLPDTFHGYNVYIEEGEEFSAF